MTAVFSQFTYLCSTKEIGDTYLSSSVTQTVAVANLYLLQSRAARTVEMPLLVEHWSLVKLENLAYGNLY